MKILLHEAHWSGDEWEEIDKLQVKATVGRIEKRVDLA